MTVREIEAKSILSPSKIYTYVVNPYVGCQFSCSYCYARYMKRYSGHDEEWGDFVDVKVNAADLLAREILKKPVGRVWVSGVCDCYQPLEKKYEITRACVGVLAAAGWPFTVQTKSPLVTRDIDILREASGCEVGFSMATGDDRVRALFEPGAPPIGERVDALRALRSAGIPTFAMVAPALPGAGLVMKKLAGLVDYVNVDDMNYHYADGVYRENGLERYRTPEYFRAAGRAIAADCAAAGIRCSVFFRT
jgi:DNA repair photolyase